MDWFFALPTAKVKTSPEALTVTIGGRGTQVLVAGDITQDSSTSEVRLSASRRKSRYNPEAR